MRLLVVGSIALDSVETPFGNVTDALGGSAVFFSSAASLIHPVQMVGVEGVRLKRAVRGSACVTLAIGVSSDCCALMPRSLMVMTTSFGWVGDVS